MQITVEKTETGLWRVTSSDARLHVTGNTAGEALRNAGNLLDALDESVDNNSEEG